MIWKMRRTENAFAETEKNMFLHIGGNQIVNIGQIVGIIDIEKATISQITREFLKDAEKSGRVINVSDELPKTFVITKDKNVEKVFISPISSKTLFKRSSIRKGMK